MAEHRGIAPTALRTSAIKRAVLGVAALLAVLGSVAFSIAQVTAKTDPVLAHRLAPYDGSITAGLAASLAGANATAADRVRSDALSREALRLDPTAVVALSTLGINAQIRGDTGAARQFFAFSQYLSRRELQTQLWAIEDAVGRGRIDEALVHYNIALRVSPRISDVLFPVLASASFDPSVASALVRTLSGRPLWSNSFVNYLAANSSEPQLTSKFLMDLSHSGGMVQQYAQATIINKLIVGGHSESAWAYYASLGRGQRQHSRDAHFTRNLEVPSQFDWLANNDSGLVTSIQNGTFYFAAPPSVGGILLQQVQFLPAGEYGLRGQGGGVDQVDDARPYWVLRCQDGRELGQVKMPYSANTTRNFSGRFHVPAGCPLQTLGLIARPSDAAGGLTGQVNWVELAPMG